MPHPLAMELRTKLRKLESFIDGILDASHSDLIVTLADTGDADLRCNREVPRELFQLGKDLMVLGQQCMTKAEDMKAEVERYIARTLPSHKVQFLKEVTNPEVKDVITKLRNPIPVLKTGEFVTWQMKVEVPLTVDGDSDSESDTDVNMTPDERFRKQVAKEVFGGDPDSKFLYPKDNENDAAKYNYNCAKCEKIFRTLQELRNHVADHRKEFYTCTKCFRCMRTFKSFKQHRKVHEGKRFKCQHCSDDFEH